MRIYGSIKDEGGFEVFIEESTSTHTRPYPGNRQEMDAINETGHEPSMRAKLQQLLHKFQEYQLKEPALLSKETEVFLGKVCNPNDLSSDPNCPMPHTLAKSIPHP